MKNQSHKEVIADEVYSQGFDAGKKASNKKYQKLLDAAKNWMHIYESSFGQPEECKEFFELKRLIN